MQAYERGETIECASVEREERVWVEVNYPLWDWSTLEYRVKPKWDKFKADDKVVFLADEGIPLTHQDVPFYKDIIDFDNTHDDEIIKADDVLWYWEYQDADDHWEKSDYRATRAEIEKLSNFHNFAPLYGLGFRIKDEK